MKKNRIYGLMEKIGLFKMIKIMRFTIFILFLSLSQTFAVNSYSQQAKLSLDMRNARVEDVIDKIEKNSEFFFMYNKNMIDVDRKVDIQVEEKSINQILDKIFENTGITYSIKDRQILLINNRLQGEVKDSNTQQQKSISGKVSDSSGGSLPGVSIVIKGTNTGVITDANGNFSLSNVPANATLQFSFVGMKTQEITVGSKTTINVTLAEETVGIEEVVAIGYGVQKKVNLTGSVNVVSGGALENRSAPNVSLLIQGKAPNLNIGMTNHGGEPGAAPNWNIRGLGSIAGNSSPLILIDGVESNINNIDPESIESVSILKDASASAIYGSRAPFGVVLITTKKGNKNQGIRISYNNNLSIASPLKIPHFVDSYTWATSFNQVAANSGLAPIYSAEQVDRIKGYTAGTYKTEYNPQKPPASIFAGRWDGNANYDWPGMYYKKASISQKHNINLEGGDGKTQYYASAGYFDQGGLYSWGKDSYKRYNVMANITSQVTDWLRFESSTKYAKTKTDWPLGMVGTPRTYIMRGFLSFSPMTPYHNEDGSINNPLVNALQGVGRDKTQNDDLGITLRTEIEPIPGWKTNISYNYNYGGQTNVQNPKPYMVEVPTNPITFGNIGASSSGYIESLSTSSYTLANALTSYEKTIKGHYFKALVGYEQEEGFFRGLYGSKMDMITPEVPSISTALGAVTLYDQINHWSTQGIFGRLNYNYKEKYLVEFSSRYNGSSRFAKESRWGFFPSVSAGYNIAKENFWTSLEPYVNTLKFRGSYGSLGNQNISNYLYLSTVPVNSNLLYIIGNERPVYAKSPAITSDHLTWETITTFDLGIDAGFMKNRLNLVFDWYNRITSDMLGPAESLPLVLGTGAPYSNNAELSTKGFEISLDWKDQISTDLSYNVGISIGDSKATILKYKNDNGLIDTWYEGKNIGEIWGLVTDKIMQTAEDVAAMPDQSLYYAKWGIGDMQYKDLNGDGKINEGNRTLADHGDLKVLGNITPRYNIGINAGITWKAFDVSMFWQGVGKRDYLPSSSASAGSNLFFGFVLGGRAGSESALYKDGQGLDYWRPADDASILGPNTDAYFAKPYFTGEIQKNHLDQSRYVLNASYLRLKNLQIGYTLPQELSRKVYVYKARFYISGENLLTLSTLPKILDPETAIVSDPRLGTQNTIPGTLNGEQVLGAIYPISRAISVGINITF